MCGICGKLNFDAEKPVEAGLVRKMMDLILHRGPDGSGEFHSGPVGLGHVRLSIIDLNTGTQPMSNEDGTVWVVYNGEIYNFRQLRVELENRGHRFKSTTDTEVIVHMYEEMGDECVTRFQGMFAFALWDVRRQRLLLARDRVGIKPLYFANTGRSLVFASEIKALLADPEVDRRINQRAIDRFLTYYYLPGNETMLEGIVKLDPGHYLTVADGRISIRQYWDLHFDHAATELTFDAAAEKLRGLFASAVQDHMVSDVPVGVLLSGGVDSTAVLSQAVSHAEPPIHTFTMGFSGSAFADERPYARMAAAKFGTVHREISMSASDFRDFLPRYVWHMEEPVCEPPAVALFFVAQLARESGVKVLLSGEGGDEAFGGYPEYRNLLLLEQLKTGFGPLKGVLRSGFEALSWAGWTRGRHYASLVRPTPEDYYLSRTSTPASPFNRLKRSLYDQDFAAALGHQVSYSPTQRLWERTKDMSLLNRMLYVDTKTWLPDDLLVKADKMTMATSVELRVPLLDSRILEYAASLPDDYKVSRFKLKRLLKEAMAPYVPSEILFRKKTGFPVPYAQWMRQDMRDFVSDTLLAANSFSRTCFSSNAVSGLLRSCFRGEGCAKEVFSLLVLELWHAQFMSSPASVRPPSEMKPGRRTAGLALPAPTALAA